MYNQQYRRIIIKRTSDKEERDYLKISRSILKKASYNLSGNALKLYLYFCSNSNNWKLSLSSKVFCEEFANITKPTYRKAFKELEEKGYLIQQGDEYVFNEVGLLSAERTSRR